MLKLLQKWLTELFIMFFTSFKDGSNNSYNLK